MKYIFPKRFKLNKEDEESARKVYRFFLWLLIGTVSGSIIFTILLPWIL